MDREQQPGVHIRVSQICSKSVFIGFRCNHVRIKMADMFGFCKHLMFHLSINLGFYPESNLVEGDA